MSIGVTRVKYDYNDSFANSIPEGLSKYLMDRFGHFYRVVDRPANGRTNLEFHICDYFGFCSPRQASAAAEWGKQVSDRVRSGEEMNFRFDD